MLESMNTLQLGGPYEDIDVRLYPTGRKSPTHPGRSTQTMVSFRSVVSYPIPVGEGPMTRTCLTWLTVDGQVYGSFGIDKFVFHVGEDGNGLISAVNDTIITLCTEIELNDSKVSTAIIST
jgi:hypothetical protein